MINNSYLLLHPYFSPVKQQKTPPCGRVSGAFSFSFENLRRFEVSLHNPSCKLHKTMHTGALPYFNALTDTRRCLPYVIIVHSRRKYVNVLLTGFVIKIKKILFEYKR